MSFKESLALAVVSSRADPWPRSVVLKNCVAVKVVRGFHVDAVATESCTVTMDSGHTNEDNVGAWIVDASNVQIKEHRRL